MTAHGLLAPGPSGLALRMLGCNGQICSTDLCMLMQRQGAQANLHEEGQRRVKYHKKWSSHPGWAVMFKTGASPSVEDCVWPCFFTLCLHFTWKCYIWRCYYSQTWITLIVANQSALNCHLWFPTLTLKASNWANDNVAILNYERYGTDHYLELIHELESSLSMNAFHYPSDNLPFQQSH